jgi:toxin ParE1/3/4
VKLVWTKAAIRDLAQVRRHIAQDNPEAAASVASRILEAVGRLPRHPEMGRMGRVRGTRERVVTRTPCLIPYRIPYRSRPKVIELLRVLHGRQEWPASTRVGPETQPTRKKIRR